MTLSSKVKLVFSTNKKEPPASMTMTCRDCCHGNEEETWGTSKRVQMEVCSWWMHKCKAGGTVLHVCSLNIAGPWKELGRLFLKHFTMPLSAFHSRSPDGGLISGWRPFSWYYLTPKTIRRKELCDRIPRFPKCHRKKRASDDTHLFDCGPVGITRQLTNMAENSDFVWGEHIL